MSSNQKWIIDGSHTTVGFSVRHLMISRVTGRFSQVEGEIVGDPKDLTGGSIQATIDVKSIDTREDDRDEHLRSGDFFEADKFPEITFSSTDIQSTGDDEYVVRGDLSIKGQTHSVELETKLEGVIEQDMEGKRRIGLSATGKISRKQFGVNWNAPLEAGGVVVGDEVTLQLDVEAVQAD